MAVLFLSLYIALSFDYLHLMVLLSLANSIRVLVANVTNIIRSYLLGVYPRSTFDYAAPLGDSIVKQVTERWRLSESNKLTYYVDRYDILY